MVVVISTFTKKTSGANVGYDAFIFTGMVDCQFINMQEI